MPSRLERIEAAHAQITPQEQRTLGNECWDAIPGLVAIARAAQEYFAGRAIDARMRPDMEPVWSDDEIALAKALAEFEAGGS